MGRQLSSRQFIDLVRRVAALESRYLPEAEDILGDYSLEQQDDARSCILLSHAEIEDYLEQMAEVLCADVQDRFDMKEYNDISIRFLYFAGKKDAELKHPNSMESALKGFSTLFKKSVVKNNNGIKEKNLKNLFDPFFDVDDLFGSELLAQVDYLGTKRGECAHKGFVGIRQTINAYEVRNAIDCVVDGLFDFDTYMFNTLYIEKG